MTSDTDIHRASRINILRLIIGGLIAGVIMNVISLLAAPLYLSEMMSLLNSHGIQPPTGTLHFIIYLLMRFVWGFVAVWFYVVARQRFGPGFKTALLISLVFWTSGLLMMVVSYGMMGMFPIWMLMEWGVITLVGILASTLTGAWIYQE